MWHPIVVEILTLPWFLEYLKGIETNMSLLRSGLRGSVFSVTIKN